MGIVVGGDKAWKVRQAGPVVVAYHWIGGEPAMAIFPSLPRHGAGTFVIPLDQAWAYADSKTGAPTPYLLEATIRAADVLCMDQDRSTLRAIADAIVDGLPDLIVMPPEPDWVARGVDKAVMAELSLKADGQTVVEREVRTNGH